MSDLLPANSTALERLAAQAGAPIADLPVIIRELWHPEACPAHLLPWLAWAWSVDTWQAGWSERQQRETIKQALQVQSIKGTIGAVRQALGALGYPVRVQEWFNQSPAGEPYTFRLLLDVDQAPLTQADQVKILDVVDSTKSLRSHLETALLSVTSRAALSLGVVAAIGHDLGVAYSSPAYADGTPALDLLTDGAAHGLPSTLAGLDRLHALLHHTMPIAYW